jgi:WhiB family redox-sensing transcriptional regulator
MSWEEEARCVAYDPEIFFEGRTDRKAKAICRGCPVRLECLAAALDDRIEYGIWGGLDERQRRSLLRRLPQLHGWRSWREELAVSGIPERV